MKLGVSTCKLYIADLLAASVLLKDIVDGSSGNTYTDPSHVLSPFQIKWKITPSSGACHNPEGIALFGIATALL